MTQEERVRKMTAIIQAEEEETYRRVWNEAIDQEIMNEMIAARDKTLKELNNG